MTKESYPDGTSVEYDYTCCGLAGVVKDRAGRKSYYDYDAMKRLVRVQDAAANTLQMDYDAEGNLSRLLDGKGSITKWDYDGSNRLTKKTYADGSVQTYGYGGGRLGSTRDARNRLTGFQYDANGNLSKIDYPNQADVLLTYNSLDKPLTMTDGLGVTAFGYDTAGRLTSSNGPWANDTLSYGYDADGRRSALGVQLPNGANDVTSYAYDVLGRLDSLTSSAGVFDYSYLGNTGRLAQLLMPNGTKSTYSYTALGELDVLRNLKADGSNISSYNYDTDARGVRTQLQEQIRFAKFAKPRRSFNIRQWRRWDMGSIKLNPKFFSPSLDVPATGFFVFQIIPRWSKGKTEDFESSISGSIPDRGVEVGWRSGNATHC